MSEIPSKLELTWDGDGEEGSSTVSNLGGDSFARFASTEAVSEPCPPSLDIFLFKSMYGLSLLVTGTVASLRAEETSRVLTEHESV